MRTLIDTVCPGCGETHPDVWIDTAHPHCPACVRCGHETTRSYRYAQAPGVRPDSIPGGYLVEHGLCDPVTGEPVRYDSHSAMAREAKRRGLERVVEHIDGSPQTQRFV